MKLKKHNLYKILWIDIESFCQWFDETEVQEKLTQDDVIENVGYYVGENKDFYFFASGICKKTADGKFQYFNLDKFPKHCIKKITRK